MGADYKIRYSILHQCKTTLFTEWMMMWANYGLIGVFKKHRQPIPVRVSKITSSSRYMWMETTPALENDVLHWHEIIEKVEEVRSAKKWRKLHHNSKPLWECTKTTSRHKTLIHWAWNFVNLPHFLLLSNLIMATKIRISQLSEWPLQRSEVGIIC